MAARNTNPMNFAFLDEFLDDNWTVSIMNQFSPQAAIAMLLRRSKVPKVTEFSEATVPQFSLRDFVMHFRISKGIFHILLEGIEADLVHAVHRGGREPISPYRLLLMWLWYMVNQDSMREIAVKFDMSMSTVDTKMREVNEAVINNFMKVISWPDEHEQDQIAASFHVAHPQLPMGVIGLLDGTHIELSGRINGDQDWINRSHYPSMQLQVTVDDKLLIRNAYTGWPGCSHDARVFRNSSLYEKGEAGEAVFGDNYVLADSAYPMRRWLITPFRDNGHLTRQQRQYNRAVSGCRQSVERAIGHLKGRVRRLKEVPVHTDGRVSDTIMAGCILHNLCILNNDDIEHYIERIAPDPNNYRNIYPHANEGVARRVEVMNYVNLHM